MATIIFMFTLSKYKGDSFVNKLPSPQEKKKKKRYQIFSSTLHHMVNLTALLALPGDILIGKHQPVQQHDEKNARHCP